MKNTTVRAAAFEASTDEVWAGELRIWLTDRIATYVERPADTIARDVPLGEYGLDSVLALAVATDIEDHLEVEVSPTVLWDHPTIDELVAFLAEIR